MNELIHSYIGGIKEIVEFTLSLFLQGDELVAHETMTFRLKDLLSP